MSLTWMALSGCSLFHASKRQEAKQHQTLIYHDDPWCIDWIRNSLDHLNNYCTQDILACVCNCHWSWILYDISFVMSCAFLCHITSLHIMHHVIIMLLYPVCLWWTRHQAASTSPPSLISLMRWPPPKCGSMSSALKDSSGAGSMIGIQISFHKFHNYMLLYATYASMSINRLNDVDVECLCWSVL
jgi:hypothetical protein